MSTIIYGIKNCDTMKKAIKWLKNEDHPFEFHDYRQAGISQSLLLTFVNAFSLTQLINQRGSTFRVLDDKVKQALKQNTLSQQDAIALMMNHPAIIKRPILVRENQHYIGFSSTQYQTIFAKVT